MMGGIEGVIHDFSGKIVKNFVGPVNCVDSNRAEMYALLVGCRELRQLGGFMQIIEGDSFSTIQWGFGKSSHPWILADLVEEVQDVSSQLGASFLHIPR